MLTSVIGSIGWSKRGTSAAPVSRPAFSFGRNPLQFRVDVGLYSYELAEMSGVLNQQAPCRSFGRFERIASLVVYRKDLPCVRTPFTSNAFDHRVPDTLSGSITS